MDKIMILNARISNLDGTGECTYRKVIPHDLSIDMCKLIAYGLFFENNWTLDDTQSYWWCSQ